MTYPTRHELVQLPVSVRVNVVSAPHYIPSAPTCEHHEACECPLEFSCPLCPFESLDRSLAENHYMEVHWSNRVEIGRFTLFPCGESHATARQSVSSVNRAVHFHCPACPVSASLDQIRDHIVLRHEHLMHDVGNSCYSGGDAIIDLRVPPIVFNPSDAPSTIVFHPFVRVREFPLALSIAEQAGGRSETKKPKNIFDLYAFVYEMCSVACLDDESVGCNQPPMRLFKGLCFVICGVDVPASTISAIQSLGGVVTGSTYLESSEWGRLTHVLLGNRVGVKSIKILRKNLSAGAPTSCIRWVSSEWVRDRVEMGTIFGTQRTLVPAQIERFFSLREAAARADRRKTFRARPDIPNPLAFGMEVEPRRSSPPVLIENLNNSESIGFRETPEGSPQISAAPISINDENMIPFMPSPSISPTLLSAIESPVTQVVIPQRLVPPLAPVRRRMSNPAIKPIKAPVPAANVVSSCPAIDTSPLRRSKRLSIAVSPQKFPIISDSHHAIKKTSD